MHGREAMRAQFWPFVLSNSQLFEAMLLVSGTHLNISRKLPYEQASILRLRQNALQSINHAVSNPKNGSLDPGTIGAIALLAGWDLEFGNAENFETHMSALRAIVAKQYGTTGPGGKLHGKPDARLPPIIEDLLISMGQDLPSFSSRPIYFTRNMLKPMKQQQPDTTSTQTIPGFKTVIDQAIVIPDLLHLLSPLATFDMTSKDASSHLSSIASRIRDYDHYNGFGTKYSFLQTQQEDDMNAQGALHIRAAGLALCAVFSDALGKDSGAAEVVDTFLANDNGSTVLRQDVAALQPDILLGTVYENVLLWATTVTSTALAQRSERQLRVIARVLGDLGITSYAAFESLLSRYVFPRELLGDRCEALFPEATNMSRKHILHNTAKTGLRLTRYQRTIQHPTNVANLTESKDLGCRGAG